MPAEVFQFENSGEPPHRRPIDLAHEPPFRLGELAIAPALREVVAPDGARQTLEPRVMQVLVALVHARGAIVTRDDLIRTCWRGRIVGEDAINRAISLLRRVAEGIGREAFGIETLPRVGYRLVVSHRERGGAKASTVPPLAKVPSRPLVWAVAWMLLVALAGAIMLWPTGPEGPNYSLSVQPFEGSGGAFGFDDELSSALGSANVRTAGGNVRLYLAGAVERSNSTTRVHARLVYPDSHEVVWSSAEELPSAEPDALAGAAATMGAVMSCTLSFANDAGRSLPLGVLSRFARACELIVHGESAQGVTVARELTRQAPDFAGAWFALTSQAIGLYLRQPIEGTALREEALAAAEKLIELRPQAQEGYTYKALAMDPERAVEREELLRRAAKMEPIFVDTAPAFLGDFLLQVGRLEEAFALYRPDAEKNTAGAVAHARVFFAAAATERWPIAEQALDRVRQLDSTVMPALLWRKAVWDGDWAEAERLVPFEHPAQVAAGIATYRALASDDPARKEAAAHMVMALPNDCCVDLRIEMLTLLGRRAEAIALLDELEAGRTPGGRPGNVGLFLWNPALRPLWYDPGIEPFLRRHGWIAYWRASGTRPDLCNRARPPSFCRLLAL